MSIDELPELPARIFVARMGPDGGWGIDVQREHESDIEYVRVPKRSSEAESAETQRFGLLTVE